MDEYGWTEEFGEAGQDLWDDSFGDSEAAEFVLPALGMAAGKQLFRGRRGRRPLPAAQGRGYVPAPAPSRQVPVTQAQLARTVENIGTDVKKLVVATKTLEERLDSYSGQLAALQKVRGGEQSAELFRYAFTTAAANITPALLQKDFGQAATHALPLLQTALSQTGRSGISSSLSANPALTLSLPALAGAAMWLLRKPSPPIIKQSATGGDVELTAEASTTIRATTDTKEPTKTSTEQTRISGLKGGTVVKAKAFNLFNIESETAVFVTS